MSSCLRGFPTPLSINKAFIHDVDIQHLYLFTDNNISDPTTPLTDPIPIYSSECLDYEARGEDKNIAFARGGAHLTIAHALRLLSTKELRFGLTKFNLRRNNFLK